MTKTPRRLSIIHILAPARFGGLETVVLELATGLARSGDYVRVAPVLSGEDDATHPFVSALCRAGVDVEPIVVGAREYAKERRAIRALLESHEPDVVHTHGERPDVVDAPVARRLGIRTVSTVHGFTGAGGRKRAVQNWLHRRSFRHFDRVIAVSEKLRGELVNWGVQPHRAVTIRNAFDFASPVLDRSAARRHLGLPAEGRSVAWVGRMGKEKGPDVMIQAAARVQNETLRFSMIGTGPLLPDCQARAASLGLSERVDWHGVVADIPRSLTAFDALVITSWTEGTPMVLLEAMAAGVPVVSTAVGGIPEVVSQAEAYLCPPGAVGEIADAIDAALGDPTATAARVAGARVRLETEFALEPWVQCHQDLYRAIFYDE